VSQRGLYKRAQSWVRRVFRLGRKRAKVPKAPKLKGPKTTLQERIEEKENQLLSLTRRQYILEAFIVELDRVSRLKESKWWGDSMFLMLLDFRDQHVTHFASWAKSIYETGGLLSHVSEIPLKRRKSDKARETNDQGLAAELDRGHNASRERLFPGASGCHPSGKAVATLREDFKARMDPVLQDRHENRAHPYEGAGTGTAKMLDFPELRELITYAEEFMNDMRLLNSGTTLHYHDMSFISSEALAKDLVDILLLGPEFRRDAVMGAKNRETFYAELHARHDALEPATKAKQVWNDNYPNDE
jgi:hypothetical protein